MWKDTVRATLRNLYVNVVLCATIIGYYFIKRLLLYTEPTDNISSIMSIILIALIVGWALFFCHWIGETCLELKRKNYLILYSFIPFVLPPLCFLLHNPILSILPAME